MLKLQYKLTDLLDIDELGEMLQQLCSLTNMPLAIVDLEGNVLKGVGWQRICLDFHRKNSASCKLCIECDTQHVNVLPDGKTSIVYTCPHGLIDSLCPLLVNGQHLANVFAGQVLHEPVSEELRIRFRHQAHRYGFDEVEYMQALAEVPVFSAASHTRILDFISVFTRNIASMGLTRLKELEQTEMLRKNEEQLRMTLEAIDDGLWDWDLERDIITWSPRAYTMLGYEADAFPINYGVWQDLIHPQDRIRTHEAFLQSISSDKPFRNRFRSITTSGDYIWVSARGKVVARTPDGSVKRVLGTVSDITKLKQAEEKFEKAFQKNPLLMAISDIESGEIIAVNDKFAQTIGYTRDEMIGRRSTDLGILTMEMRSYLKQHTQQQKTINNYAVSIRTKNGDKLQCLYFTEIIKVHGRARLLSIIQDITEQKKDEQERKLLEQQLQQSVKLEALGTLAGGIAHDFNNILTSILGHGQMALEQLPPSSPVVQDIQQMVLAGNRAADLVKQILLYSRQEKENFQPLRLQDTIQEVADMLCSSLPSSIQFRVSIDQECGSVLADPTQIHQVVMNLCTNAMQAIQDDYGLISVTLSEAAPPASLYLLNSAEQTDQRHACIEICDSGRGIPEEIKTKIFDPFFTTKEKEKGTGLGLAVVNGIVQNHQGTILLESAPGVGTVFQIYLPIVEEEFSTVSTHVNLPQSGRERVLLIDDENVLIDLHKRALEELGYQVTCFSDSLEALNDFQQKPEDYDIIVTDMTMPNLTGLDLIREILKIRPEAQSILCTGYSRSVNRVEAKSFGVCEFLVKPFPPRVLAETIRKVLDNG
ncbi:MAG: PocR ligand-binding domain-containing protein [Proteobacteria bacterium]|nr:PocR ligand-binding domain-containing protein [Pseudomonadota bacterium]MBU1455494.1 PocR ligand-binding domain-containing protein [Pseudomonadota bacterium]